MKKTILLLLVLISFNANAYNADDLMSFLSCYNQPTHIVTGEPLFCDEWDLDGDDDVDANDLLILIDEFGQ